MRRLKAWISLGALAPLLAFSPASAETLDGGGRFQIEPIEGDIARLDTVTGEVDLCRVVREEMVCEGARPAPSRDFEKRLYRLEMRVEALARRARRSGTEDADRAAEQMGRILEGFRDMIREFEHEPQEKGGGEGESERGRALPHEDEAPGRT